jgi:hypothetical protein
MNRTPESPGRDDDNVEQLHPGRPAGSGGRRIAAEDLERIVRRAAQMQQRAGEPGQHSLTEADVLQIGRQVGLEPDYVRRALAEVHAESLMPAPPTDARLFGLLAGDARVPVRRVVPGEPEGIQQQLEAVLENEENLKPLRRRAGRSVWEPSSNMFDRVQRSLGLDGRSYTLAQVRHVDLAVAELEPGWTLVTATADLTRERNEALAGGGFGALFAVTAAGVLTHSMDMEQAFQLAVASAGLTAMVAAAIAIPWMRWHMGEKRARIALGLEGLLDRVDNG